MSRIDTSKRVLAVKIVYYGPAMGGKTTNLRSLHGMVDPSLAVELRSLETEGDRTLFFDLLPIELGDIGGFKLKLRLFTVPGQVHYNATRRLVLQGADAVVFVADSSPQRMDANRESMANLRANLIANGIAPGVVPIVLQANKRDLADAVSLEGFAAATGVGQLEDHARGLLPSVIAAAAFSGGGVVETFEVAVRAAVAAVHQHHSMDRLGISREQLGYTVHQALGPIRQRAASLASARTTPQRVAPPAPTTVRAEKAIALEAMLAESVRQTLDLAEELGDSSATASALGRRVKELETINELARVLTRTVDPSQIAKAIAVAAQQALPAGCAALLAPDEGGVLREMALAGLDRDPLLHCGEPPIAWVVHRASRPVHWVDLENDLLFGDATLASLVVPHRTGAAVPLRLPSGRAGLLIAYGGDPDGRAGPETTRFLASIASQASLAFQNADRHAQLLAHQESLEAEVAARTAELRLALEELVAGSRMKDRILSCVNHELRTPVTKLLAAAQILERAKPGSPPPPSFMASVVEQARHLASLLDQALSARQLLAGGDESTREGPGCADLVRTVEAVAFTCHERAAARGVSVEIARETFLAGESETQVAADAGPLSLILSQLLDNAVKFTKAGTKIQVRVVSAGSGRVRVLVKDHGPGVPPEDVDRIFAEFDQGGSDPLVAKPRGLGLGLSIARRLARRLGGEVGLESHGAGPGAIFWVEMPLVEQAVSVPCGA